MNTFVVIFVLYLAGILAIGLWARDKVKSFSDYAVAGRNLGLLLATGTYVASFVSASMAIAQTGYASRFGMGHLGWALGVPIGWCLLALIAKKLHLSKLSTIPQLMTARYNSSFLRSLSAIVICAGYFFMLQAQLFAAGIIVNMIVGIPVFWGILLIGVIFIIYTTLGGLVAVVRTDLIQSALLASSLIALFFIVNYFINATPNVSWTSNPSLTTVWGGPTSTWGGLLAWIAVWAIAIPSQPYYLHRFFAVKDVRTARYMIGIGSFIILLVYIAVNFAGMGIGILHPEQAGDGAIPWFLTTVLHPVLGGLIMVGIACAIMSTTDSLLHIVGVYSAFDLYGVIFNKGASNEQLLRMSKYLTFIFGAAVVIISAIQSTRALPTLALLIGFAIGLIAAGNFVPVFFGAFWKRANRAGATVAMLGGFIGAIVGKLLNIYGVISFHEIYIVITVAVLGMVIFSYLTPPSSHEELERFFSADEIASLHGNKSIKG